MIDRDNPSPSSALVGLWSRLVDEFAASNNVRSQTTSPPSNKALLRLHAVEQITLADVLCSKDSIQCLRNTMLQNIRVSAPNNDALAGYVCFVSMRVYNHHAPSSPTSHRSWHITAPWHPHLATSRGMLDVQLRLLQVTWGEQQRHQQRPCTLPPSADVLGKAVSLLGMRLYCPSAGSALYTYLTVVGAAFVVQRVVAMHNLHRRQQRRDPTCVPHPPASSTTNSGTQPLADWVERMASAALVLWLANTMVRTWHPDAGRTLDSLAALVTIAAGYANTARHVKRGTVHGAALETAWTQRHKWAAQLVGPLMTDLAPGPLLGPLLDAVEGMSVTMGRVHAATMLALPLGAGGAREGGSRWGVSWRMGTTQLVDKDGGGAGAATALGARGNAAQLGVQVLPSNMGDDGGSTEAARDRGDGGGDDVVTLLQGGGVGYCPLHKQIGCCPLFTSETANTVAGVDMGGDDDEVHDTYDSESVDDRNTRCTTTTTTNSLGIIDIHHDNNNIDIIDTHHDNNNNNSSKDNNNDDHLRDVDHFGDVAPVLFGRGDHAAAPPPTTMMDRVALGARAVYLLCIMMPFLLLGPLLLITAAALENRGEGVRDDGVRDGVRDDARDDGWDDGRDDPRNVKKQQQRAAAASTLRTVAFWLLLHACRAGGAAFIKWGQWGASREDVFPRVCGVLYVRCRCCG